LSLPKTDSTFFRIEDRLYDAASQRESRLKRLRGKIMALSDSLERTHAGTEEPPSTPDVSQSSEPDTPRTTGDKPATMPNEEHQALNDTNGPPSEKQTQPSPPAEDDDNEPVDRISLADNLFGTGETELAMRVYSEVEPITVSASDRLWVRYQLACCHRRQGASSEAESMYREIANSPDAPDLAMSARWWLDTIQRRKRLEQREQQLRQQSKVWEDYVRERTK